MQSFPVSIQNPVGNPVPISGSVVVTSVPVPLSTNSTGLNPTAGLSYSLTSTYNGTPVANSLASYSSSGTLTVPAGTYQVILTAQVSYTAVATPICGSFILCDSTLAPPILTNVATSSGMEALYTGSTNSSGICSFIGTAYGTTVTTNPTTLILTGGVTMKILARFVATGTGNTVFVCFSATLTRI
jgi:hypothetical protein